MPESDRKARISEEREFAMGCLRHSDEARRQDKQMDREVLANYFVLPPRGNKYNTASFGWRGIPNRPVLISAETHKMIESLVAAELLQTMTKKGFVQADPVGREDAYAARTTSKLLERTFRVAGNFRNAYVHAKDKYLFGSAVYWPFWDYQEGPRRFNQVALNPFTGQETLTSVTEDVVWVDDVNLNPIDIWDFFYDPSADTMRGMQYAFRRFRISARSAMAKVEAGLWDRQKVKRAIQSASGTDEEHGLESPLFRDAIDRPNWHSQRMMDDYDGMVGYEGYARVPYRPRDGITHRRLTLLQGELVESTGIQSSVSRIVPAYDSIVNPIQGRWRGVSPGAVARYSQDFATGLLMTLAESVTRKAGVPVIYNRNVRPNLRKLRDWRGPIDVAGPIDQIRELQYNPPLQEAFALWQNMNLMIQEQSSAQGPIAGQSLGTKRFSASEATAQLQGLLNRPEAQAALEEGEYLPELGKGILEMSQENILTQAELAAKVGQSELGFMPQLSDIQGDFDIKFVGSSRIRDNEQLLGILERSMQIAGSVPGAAPNYPWALAFMKWFELAGMRELEEAVANPQIVQDYMAQQATLGLIGGPAGGGASGNGNATSARLAPPGLLPAQTAGQAAL